MSMTKLSAPYRTRGNLALVLHGGLSSKKDIQIISIATFGKKMFLLRCPSFFGVILVTSYRPTTGWKDLGLLSIHNVSVAAFLPLEMSMKVSNNYPFKGTYLRRYGESF